MFSADGCSRRVPWGWKLSQDSTGACQVATPADWQIGREFFLQHENAETLKDRPERFPVHGFALWRINRADGGELPQLARGTKYQVRTSLVRGDGACSVWRIKEGVNFTGAERRTMNQVGKTLRWLP